MSMSTNNHSLAQQSSRYCGSGVYLYGTKYIFENNKIKLINRNALSKDIFQTALQHYETIITLYDSEQPDNNEEVDI